MKATIELHDVQIMSKQHSRGMRYGRTFTNHAYTAAKDALYWRAKGALYAAGWENPVACNVAVALSYRANRMNVDNVVGFVLDALEGCAYLKDGQVDVLRVRKRRKGPTWVGISLRTLERRRAPEAL